MTFSPEEQYAHVTLTYLVDNVCLHSAKVDEVRKAYQDQLRTLEASGQDDEEQRAHLTQQMQEEENAVPLFAVPRSSKARRRTDGPDSNADKSAAGAAKKLVDKDRSSVNLTNE